MESDGACSTEGSDKARIKTNGTVLHTYMDNDGRVQIMHPYAYFHTRERVFAVSLYSLVIYQILKLRIRQHFLYVVSLAGPCGKSALSKFRHIYPAIKYYPRIFPVPVSFHLTPRTSRHQNATHHTHPAGTILRLNL